MSAKSNSQLPIIVIVVAGISLAANVILAAWKQPASPAPSGNASGVIQASSTSIQTLYSSLALNGLFSVANSWDSYFTGKMGIGVITPSQVLDVLGGIGFTGPLTISSNAGTFGQALTSQGSSTAPKWLSAPGISDVPSGYSTGSATSTVPSSYTYIGDLFAFTNSWVTRTSMPTARSQASATALNNIIYVIGGYNGTSVPVPALTTNEAYDPSTNAWTTKASMPTARQAHVAVAVGTAIYVIGGYSNLLFFNTNEAYTPSTDTWTTKTSMPTKRSNAAAAVAGNGNIIYVLGGYDGVNAQTGSLNEAYDPSANSWTTKASMPTTRYGLTAASVNNLIYAIGGYGTTLPAGMRTANEAYDPSTNTWTTKSPMPTARSGVGAGVINNIIYVVGGYDGSNYLTTDETYDPSNNSWAAKSSLSTARTTPGVAVVNSAIYVIGGYTNPAPTNLATNEVFSPVVPVANYYVYQK